MITVYRKITPSRAKIAAADLPQHNVGSRADGGLCGRELVKSNFGLAIFLYGAITSFS